MHKQQINHFWKAHQSHRWDISVRRIVRWPNTVPSKVELLGQLQTCWPHATLKQEVLKFWVEGEALPLERELFLSLFFHIRSKRLFLQTRGCCTCAAANTQEQEAKASMKVHEMEADSNKGKQYFGWSSFWRPIRPQCLYDLPLPLPAFMCLVLLCVTQWPLIKDWAEARRQQWRHSYQISSSQNSTRPPKIRGCMVCHTEHTVFPFQWLPWLMIPCSN